MAEGNVCLRKLVQNIVTTISEMLLNQQNVDDVDVIEVVEEMLKNVALLDSVEKVSESVLRCLFEARDILLRRNAIHSKANNSVVCDGGVGRPYCDIPKDQLEFLLECNFKVKDISNMLRVSKRTIERRMREFGITKRENFSSLADADLDRTVEEIKETYPNCGSKMLLGYLRSRKIYVQRSRVRESLNRIDPIGVIARRCRCVHRRTYNVTRPLGLWHIDGNHKLVKWRLVVHGCVDGYSRNPVFLACSVNNRAETVLELCIKAVEEWGLPSRIRTDKGGENVDVVRYMLNHPLRGPGRGSAITGRSVHNQRIERLWVDVYSGVLSYYYNLFTGLEDCQTLDPNDELDLWSLHLSFVPKINASLQCWVEGWIRHPLRTEHNKSPLQLWVEGMARYHSIIPLEINLQEINQYGIDWEGPVGLDDESVYISRVEVPEIGFKLGDDQVLELQDRVNQLASTCEDGVQLYLSIRDVLRGINMA